MYTINATVTDDDGGAGSGSVMVIVYDPDAGFATGGGHIESAVGAAGKGQFQFNPHYRPGEDGPAASGGKVRFRLDSENVRLQSTGLEWLVVTPDRKVAVKGTGTLAGRDGGYGFVMYSYDADPDRYRIVVWPLDEGRSQGRN
jgi:hypothetical protein